MWSHKRALRLVGPLVKTQRAGRENCCRVIGLRVSKSGAVVEFVAVRTSGKRDESSAVDRTLLNAKRIRWYAAARVLNCAQVSVAKWT